MINATIKEEFLNSRIAFGKNANAFHKRTEDEINDLAIMALESNNPTLLRLFETLPPLADLKKQKTDAALGKKKN